MRLRLAACGAIIALASCGPRKPPAPPPPPPKYVLEPAWQAGDAWFYPHETFNYDQTGIAAVIGPDHAALTTDDEAYDANAMAAQMQDVQLPAIAVVTNLENGRFVKLRVNDRGPTDPARLIAVTPRVALLLAMNGAARVRVQFDAAMSAALSQQMQGHTNDLAISAAPRGDVQQADLAPLAGASSETARAVATGPVVAQAAAPQSVSVPLRIAENVTAGYPNPGVLMIDCGTFTHEDSARQRLATLYDTSAALSREGIGGRIYYRIEAGPYPDIASADAALARILQSGIPDARIVVELR